MKNLFVLTICFLMATSISLAQTEKKEEAQPVNKKAPEITFVKNLHDFGEIPNKGDGTYEFEFKNTGKEPLTITNVRTSCGCTTPFWPKEPINKGKTGVIKVKYDTKRVGNFTKTITVTSNAKNSTEVLTIKGKVLPAENNGQEQNNAVEKKEAPQKVNKVEKLEKEEIKEKDKSESKAKF